jgi:hypothetical protein
MTPDLLFSYWVFTWFIVYYFFPLNNLFRKKINPFIALSIDIFLQCAFTIYLFFKGSFSFFPLFLLMGFLFKVLPLYLIFNDERNIPYNIVCVILLFITYNIYLWINKTNIIKVYDKTTDSLIHNKKDTPFIYFTYMFKL